MADNQVLIATSIALTIISKTGERVPEQQKAAG